jgi:membrane-bound lytic murein transglycosylase D
LLKKKFVSLAFAAVLVSGIAAWHSSEGGSSLPSESVVDAKVARKAVRAAKEFTPLPLDDENPAIQKYLTRYTEKGGLQTTIRGFERARGKRGVAERIFEEEGVPRELVWLAQVESGWRVQAVSPAAAAGVWQFIPRTAQRFGLNVEEGRDDRYDFERQTRVAARYLRFLYDYYDGDWPLAIGAYNTGEENMDRAIARGGGVKDFWVLRERDLLHPETAEYVPKVLAASIVGTEPGRFGLAAYAPKR